MTRIGPACFRRVLQNARQRSVLIVPGVLFWDVTDKEKDRLRFSKTPAGRGQASFPVSVPVSPTVCAPSGSVLFSFSLSILALVTSLSVCLFL